MLASLHIENFAIVSQLELDFSDGMTAFTGETGAGKSIMIDALMLALGGRTDLAVIRPGATKCDISACFAYESGSPVEAWLRAHELESIEQTVILRRVISSEGRSKSFVNGQPQSVQTMKELAELLVDIHGQHQHQTLMQHPTHRQLLDEFANHVALVEAVAYEYRQCQLLEAELDQLNNQDHSSDRAMFLQYQLEELTKLDVQPGEMQGLTQEHQLLHHAHAYLQESQRIVELLNADDAPSILQNLNQVQQGFASLPKENAHVCAAVELIGTALIQCEEALDEIQQFAEQVELNPERLQWVETRMGALHQASRKYHVDADGLSDHALQLESELQQMQGREEKSSELAKALQQQVLAYESAAKQLHDSRAQHAQVLAQEITKTIQTLGMPQGYIQIAITPLDKRQPHGKDKVEYLVCTNPGMAPDLLSKVASGGELSRISLAIRLITAQRGATPTLLFDEVDVGIGGATAALVGQHLRELGKRLQLFCVTHQPQVASAAHHHFLVEKYTEDSQTFSTITALNSEERVEEIARMLGGLTITDQTRNHAKEMLASM